MAVSNLIPSTCLFNGRKIEFKLNIGSYQNIILFLDINNISFLYTMQLDFTKIPPLLHGRGNSNNLLEYLANNTNDSSLIIKFLNFFLMDIIDIRYSSNKKLNFHFNENSNWQNMTLETYAPYVPGTTTTTTSTSTTSSTTTTSTSTTTTTPAPSSIIRKGPYIIYDGINTEMTIHWQNIETSIDTIIWGTTLSYLDGSVFVAEYGSDHQHRYTITGLTVGTEYFYKITILGINHFGSFISAPDENATSLKFLAYGDTRTNVSDHNAVAQEMGSIYTAEPAYKSLIISVGDLVQNGAVDYVGDGWDTEWFTQTQPGIRSLLANSPIMNAVGNHELDYYSTNIDTYYKKYFKYPYVADKYYTYTYGPVQFFVLDQYTTDYLLGTGSTQYNWFISELSSSTKPWKIVYYHQPGWSANVGHGNDAIIQNAYEPLFEQYGVHITFAGHNHYYARAIVNSGLTTEVTHITTGGGGAPLGSLNLSYPNVVSGSSVLHFCKIDITNEFIMNVEVINTTGGTIDSFTINQTPPVTTTTTTFPVTTTTTTFPVTTTTTTNVPMMMFELFGQLYNF